MTEAQIQSAIIANKVAVFGAAKCLPGARWDEVNAPGRLYTGIKEPIFNGLFVTAPLPEHKDWDGVLKTALLPFTQSNTPALVHIPKALSSAPFERALANLGFSPLWKSIGVCFDSKTAHVPALRPPTLVRSVRTSTDWSIWIRAMVESFKMTPHASAGYQQFGEIIGFSEDCDFQHLLVEYEGEPAGTATVFFNSGVAGISNIGVPERFRNRGLGTALSLAALDLARAPGVRYLIGSGSPLGMQVYRKAGIQEIGAFEMWGQ